MNFCEMFKLEKKFAVRTQIDQIFSLGERKNSEDVVLDISQAFNRIWYNTLIHKL